MDSIIVFKKYLESNSIRYNCVNDGGILLKETILGVGNIDIHCDFSHNEVVSFAFNIASIPNSSRGEILSFCNDYNINVLTSLVLTDNNMLLFCGGSLLPFDSPNLINEFTEYILLLMFERAEKLYPDLMKKLYS